MEKQGISAALLPAAPSSGKPMSSFSEPSSAGGESQTPLRKVANVDQTDRGGHRTAKEDAESGDNVELQSEKPRRTIRQIREAAQSRLQEKQNSQPPASPHAPPSKKKPSILGGLLQVREPTQIALNQVTQQIVAQHGSTSATKVPHVRMEKMPDFVPKVNSKWDGIPEGVKQMQKREKEREKGRAKGSSRDGGASRDRKDGERGSLNSRQSSSTTDSFASRGRSSGSHTASGRARPWAPSANSSGDLASQGRAGLARTVSQQSPSSTGGSRANSADIASVIPIHRREDNRALLRSRSPKRYADGEVEVADSTASDRARIGQPQSALAPPVPSIKTLPPQSGLPLSALQEHSHPAHTVVDTHASHSHTRDNVLLTSSGVGVLGPPTVVNSKIPNTPSAGFLAGGAQESGLTETQAAAREADLPPQMKREVKTRAGRSPSMTSYSRKDSGKQPDGFRARLVKEEVTPWEFQEKQPAPVSSPVPAIVTDSRPATKPRTKFSRPFPFFGKDKAKSSA